MENWEPEPYKALVFSHGMLPADAQAILKSLQNSPSNLKVTVVDVDKPASPDALKLWQAHGAPALPWLAVNFPNGGKLAWSGALDAPGLASLLDSPARKQLRQQLLGGTSAVWVLLESGDAARDDKIAALLQTQSVDLANRLQLPKASPEELRSSLPLKLEFSVLRVARTAPEEKFFAAQLLQPELNPHPENLERAEALVFPVFGRGRALPAFMEKELLPETLTGAAQFLTSACSCEAKELTPGVHLLVAADWETELTAGKYQHIFFGKFAGLSDSQKLGPDVCGSFVTNASDKKPGRTFLVKVETSNKVLRETIKRFDGMNAQVTGKLEEIGPDNEAKYLIVSSALAISATPPPVARRKPGGL